MRLLLCVHLCACVIAHVQLEDSLNVQFVLTYFVWNTVSCLLLCSPGKAKRLVSSQDPLVSPSHLTPGVQELHMHAKATVCSFT